MHKEKPKWTGKKVLNPAYCYTQKKECWVKKLVFSGSMSLKKANERCLKCQKEL